MLAKQRQDSIMEILTRQGYCTTALLASQLGVAPETLRRDLAHMEKNGLLRRVHGGARTAHPAPYVPYEQRQLTNKSGKEKLVALALTLLRPGQTIALDPGATCSLLAQALARRPVAGLTVVTNSLRAAWILSQSPVTLILTGGVLQGDEASLTSPLALPILKNVNIDLYFMSALGLTTEGCTDQRLDEIAVQQAFMARADRTAALVDSSKFNLKGPFPLAPLDGLWALITDSKPDQALENALRDASCQLMIAEE